MRIVCEFHIWFRAVTIYTNKNLGQGGTEGLSSNSGPRNYLNGLNCCFNPAEDLEIIFCFWEIESPKINNNNILITSSPSTRNSGKKTLYRGLDSNAHTKNCLREKYRS